MEDVTIGVGIRVAVIRWRGQSEVDPLNVFRMTTIIVEAA